MKMMILIAVLLIVSGCGYYDGEVESFSQEESQEIAQDYIEHVHQYKEYNGDNLQLIKVDTLRCPSCYSFVYEFGVETGDVDAAGFRVTIPVVSGNVENVMVEELTEAPLPVEEVIDMTGELCTGAGGKWNTCSSKCQIDNQGKEGVACTMQCEMLCECSGIAGFNCPSGYKCNLPEGIADALGYCVSLSRMTLEEALVIAGNSECVEDGELTDTSSYNDHSKTWWINLEIEKPGCNPACVVSEETLQAEINWRCTGMLT